VCGVIQATVDKAGCHSCLVSVVGA